MVEKERARLRLLAYAGLYFFWGTTFLGIRIAVQSGLPPFFLSGLRHGVAGVLLLALARWVGAPWPTRSQMLGAALLGVLFLAAANGTCAWAMQYVESGYATLVIAGVPLAAFAYSAAFQGKAVHRTELALLLLGLSGVGILFSPTASSLHSSNPWGLVALVVATLIWSVTMAEKKRFAQPNDALMLTAFQMLGGGSVLGIVSMLAEQPWTLDLGAIPAQAWGAWAYLVIFGSCVGYGSFSYLLSIDSPQRVGTYAYVNPIVAVLAGHWMLGEAISPIVLVSSALIVASVAGLLSMNELKMPQWTDYLDAGRGKKRCGWCGTDPLYVAYHDHEWGVPVTDDRQLFEFLILEGAQAGLSWITILRRRETYRKAYKGFDPKKVAAFTAADRARLLADPGIIRNRLKVDASIGNAKAFLAVQKEFGSFARYAWAFAQQPTLRTQRDTFKGFPATSAESDAWSKDLKKRGFKFVGSTIVYAHMQATGMVNDHLVGCFRYKKIGPYKFRA